jgi:hypothetical protein
MIIQYSLIYLAQLLVSPALKNSDSIDQIRKYAEADTSIVLRHDQSTEYSPSINDESLEALSDNDIEDTPPYLASVSSSKKGNAYCQYSPKEIMEKENINDCPTQFISQGCSPLTYCEDVLKTPQLKSCIKKINIDREMTAKENNSDYNPRFISKACSPMTYSEDILKTPELKSCKKKVNVDHVAKESFDEQWKSDYVSTFSLDFSPLMDDSFLSSIEGMKIAEDCHSPVSLKAPVLNLTEVPKLSPLMDRTFLSSFEKTKPKDFIKEEPKKSPEWVSAFQSRFFHTYGDHKHIAQKATISNKPNKHTETSKSAGIN